MQKTATLQDAFLNWQKYEGIEYDTTAALVSKLPPQPRVDLLPVSCMSQKPSSRNLQASAFAAFMENIRKVSALANSTETGFIPGWRLHHSCQTGCLPACLPACLQCTALAMPTLPALPASQPASQPASKRARLPPFPLHFVCRPDAVFRHDCCPVCR